MRREHRERQHAYAPQRQGRGAQPLVLGTGGAGQGRGTPAAIALPSAISRYAAPIRRSAVARRRKSLPTNRTASASSGKTARRCCPRVPIRPHDHSTTL